ncbi:MAG: exodeoxyribonuclease VII small subunit [Planctomycetota bacterium]|nr:exodeoxyribonuclease VII small subunit [Planctomycetota bacterium]
MAPPKKSGPGAASEPEGSGAPAPTYEQAIARLEDIVRRIESGEAGLEESIRLYEEGVALGQRCREILARAEQRVEQVSREAAGLDSPPAPGAEGGA